MAEPFKRRHSAIESEVFHTRDKEPTMNLDDAVAAHAQWKIKFRMAITKKETLDAAAIGKDNCCELGKWLHGAGRITCGAKPEFTALIEKHKNFHQEAGKLASAINAKDFDGADKMLGEATTFASASHAVAMAISGLKKAM